MEKPTPVQRCPWCGVDLRELTGRCYCGRTPPQKLIWITDPADGVLRLTKYDPQR